MQRVLLFIALAAVAFSSVSSFDITTLNGEWTLSVCDEGSNCRFFFNETHNFKVDEQSKTIKDQVKLLDATKNSYDTHERSFTYTLNEENNYVLTPSDGSSAYTLVFYYEYECVLYRYFQDSKIPRGKIYEVLGLQRPDKIDEEELIIFINQTLPNFPYLVSEPGLNKMQFQTSASFKADQLGGKVWYLTNTWQRSSSEGDSNRETVTYQDQCSQTFYTKNFTNGIGGLRSEHNFLWTISNWTKEQSWAIIDPVFYPDPVLPSWIHNQILNMGVLYADDNVLITLTGNKNYASLYSTKPLLSKVNQALFHANLVKVGINPLNGKVSNYNNTACDPNDFKLSDFATGDWFLTSVVDNMTDFADKHIFTACNEATFTVGNDAVNLALKGYDLENQTTHSMSFDFTYKNNNQRYLYPKGEEDNPFYLTAILPDTVLFQRSKNGLVHSFIFVNGYERKNILLNEILLPTLYPGQQIFLPFSKSECTEFISPASNLTLDFIGSDWYGLASYSDMYTDMYCYQWSIQNNTKHPFLVDFNLNAYTTYQKFMIQSTNAPLPGSPGFFLPQITNFHFDIQNDNKTEAFMYIYYQETDKFVLLDYDPSDGDFFLFFISKSLEFSSDDQSKFEQIIQEVAGEFDPNSLHITDNSKCGFNDQNQYVKLDDDEEGGMLGVY